MGKATKAQLEQWNEALQIENRNLHKQLNERLEESDVYKSLVKQLQEETQLKKMAYENLERYRARCQQLEDERDQRVVKPQEQHQDIIKLQQDYDTLKASYDALVEEHSALTSNLDTVEAELRAELQKAKAEKPHNERGAGRKPVLTDAQRNEVHQLHAQGKSLRQIAAQMGVTHTAIAKIIKDGN